MADVKKIVPFILRWEGGFVNDPDDLGGPTNKGVTLKIYKLYCRRKGYPVPTVERLKALTVDEFTNILKAMYWDACKGDEITSQGVANAIVDWAWHSGTVTAVKHIQKLLRVEADGIIGPVTLSAINSRSPLPLFGEIKRERVLYIERICRTRPANVKYYRGWMNRINNLIYED